jgi:hypothetical protein
LENVHSTDLSLAINGINKDVKSIISDTVGDFLGFDEIPVYFSEHVKRNILSFHQVSKHYNIQWCPDEDMFQIHTTSRSFNFIKQSMYMQDSSHRD